MCLPRSVHALLAVLLLAGGGQAGAAPAPCSPEEVPPSVRVVRQDCAPAPGSRVFATIEEALASIPDEGLAPGKRVVIRVGPGTYPPPPGVRTEPLALPDRVDLEGAGAAETVVASQVTLAGRVWGGENSRATLIVPGDSRIRGLRVTNTSVSGGVALQLTGTASLEDVSAYAGGPGSEEDADYGAVIVKTPPGTAPPAKVTLVRVRAAAETRGGGDVFGIAVFGALAEMSDVHALAEGGAWTAALTYLDSPEASGEVSESVFETDRVDWGIAAEVADVRLRNVTVRVIGCVEKRWCFGIKALGAAVIRDSEIAVPSAEYGAAIFGAGAYERCRIGGAIVEFAGKLSGCRTAAGEPIPDR